MEIRLPPNLWELVAASEKLRWPLGGEREASVFVAACAREGLLPIAFHALNLPALRQWRAMDSANRHRSSVISRTVSELPQWIGAEYLLLKGCDVAYRLYPSPELRPMADVDVLIHPEDRDGVVARIEARGGRRRYSRARQLARDTPDYAFDLGSGTLEVHHVIVHRTSARIDYDAIWASAVRTPRGLRLSDADALVTAAINIAKDNLSTSLLRFVDLWLMVSSDLAVVPEALARARQWKVLNALHTVLRMTELLFPDIDLKLPPRARFDSLASNAVSASGRPGLVERFRRKYWLIDRIDLRARYFFATVMAIGYGAVHRRGLRAAEADSARSFSA